MARLLEVCVDSLASARAAIAGGADRLELCSALALGGLTPYTQLLRQIRRESGIPIRCLMRPRAGDFLYSPEEIDLMARQIEELKSAGADGFVIGCLTPDGKLDMDALKPLITAAGNSGLTLHRCIDVSRDPVKTYLDAAAVGIDTVLTSGAAANCIAGIEAIGTLLQLRHEVGGPEILIGAGVKASVIASILNKHPEATAFHMSGKIELESGMLFRRNDVPMGIPGLDEWHIQQTCANAIRDAKAVLEANS
ncbi:MAG: copper homeostasis protein CutC [Oscillospiraceae bacterium]|nr:copper homeostasis protein CutC [Oscillospiraceae bacterium]